jgi:hypothetical protein
MAQEMLTIGRQVVLDEDGLLQFKNDHQFIDQQKKTMPVTTSRQNNKKKQQNNENAMELEKDDQVEGQNVNDTPLTPPRYATNTARENPKHYIHKMLVKIPKNLSRYALPLLKYVVFHVPQLTFDLNDSLYYRDNIVEKSYMSSVITSLVSRKLHTTVIGENLVLKSIVRMNPPSSILKLLHPKKLHPYLHRKTLPQKIVYRIPSPTNSDQLKSRKGPLSEIKQQLNDPIKNLPPVKSFPAKFIKSKPKHINPVTWFRLSKL